MAIRNYEFLLSASDIEPRTIQHVGVQYEHNATEINFVVPQKLCDLLSETANLKDVVFRIDVIDGEGGYHPSESIEPKIKDDGVVLSYSIGYDVASIGGVCRLCVVASRINDENCEDMIYCSAMARVEFENVYRNERQSTEFERGLNGIVNEAKGYMIASTEVNDNGELLIYYANGAFVNAGRVNLPDVDDKPTQNSQRPVASGGVYEEFENVKSNINNKFSNAVEGKAYGTKVYIDDISPIEHNLTVRIDDNILPYPYFETSKSDNNGLKWTDNGDGSIIINGFSNTLDVPFYLFKGAFVLPAGDYVFALGEGTYTNIKVCIYGDNGLIGWTENGEDILLSVSNNTTITDIYIYPDGLINFDNIVISPGLHCTDKTELKVEVRGENNFAEYAVNSDGTVEGIKSIYPVMELSVSASGGRVMCEYNRDIGAAINELEELIDNVDGASVDIVNNLISFDTDKALSANQGRVLAEFINVGNIGVLYSTKPIAFDTTNKKVVITQGNLRHNNKLYSAPNATLTLSYKNGYITWDGTAFAVAANTATPYSAECILCSYMDYGEIVSSITPYSINGLKYGVDITPDYDILCPEYEVIEFADNQTNPMWSDFIITDDYLIAFRASSDETHTLCDGKILLYNFPSMTLEKTLRHDFGHCNTVCYKGGKLLIGSLPNNNPPALYIFNNLEDWLDLADGTELNFVAQNPTIVDVSDLKNTVANKAELGNQTIVGICAVFGEQDNIVYVSSAFNKDWFKIILGKGTNQLEYGTYTECSDNNFNGTWKSLEHRAYKLEFTESDEVLQGMDYYNGKIISAHGHNGILNSYWNMSKKTMHRTLVKMNLYNADGTPIANGISEGCSVHDGYIYHGFMVQTGDRYKAVIKWKM